MTLQYMQCHVVMGRSAKGYGCESGWRQMQINKTKTLFFLLMFSIQIVPFCLFHLILLIKTEPYHTLCVSTLLERGQGHCL